MGLVGELDDATLRAAIAATPDGVLVIDRRGRVVFANPVASTLFGYDADALVGRPVDDLVPERARGPHADHRKAYSAAPRARPMGSGLDLAARRQDGREFPVEIALCPLDGGGVVAIVRDVSDRRRDAATLAQVNEQLAQVDDRERIARDLHDTAIQRLFATGLLLQRAATHAGPGDAAERIDAALEEIDATIRDIRSAIFALQAPVGLTGARDAVLQVTRQAAGTLGFAPRVEFDGLIDTAIADHDAAALVRTLRDALAELAQRGASTRVEVRVRVRDDVCLRVTDDAGAVLEWHAPTAAASRD
jgi:PAS domain S-box-containing protein